MASELPASDSWHPLRRHTSARIALGRAGGSLPTHAALEIAWAQALARDAVQEAFEPLALERALGGPAEGVLQVESRASTKDIYLRRPDLGRALSEDSVEKLRVAAQAHGPSDCVVIVSDGLSAPAVHRQAPGVVRDLLPILRQNGISLAPVVVARHARVGILDPIGTILGVRAAVILLGERPGLGTPDSLGAYLTFGPGPGKTDADRNCVSNIRPEGLAPALAARRIAALLMAAMRLGISGPGLKEDDAPLELPAPNRQIPIG